MTTDLSAVEHNNVLRQALEKILEPTTSTTEKIVRCATLQEDLQKKITSLTENLHKVSTECAERSGRIPQQLDAHVHWVKQARVRASNVRKSLEGTKSRLQSVLVHLEKLAANEEDHAKRTEAQMNSIVEALEKQGNTSFSSRVQNNNNTASTTTQESEKQEEETKVEEEHKKEEELKVEEQEKKEEEKPAEEEKTEEESKEEDSKEE